MDDEQEREKKSWREIDSERNRSRHLSDSPKPPKNKKAAYEQKREQTAAKAALEDFFSGGKKTKEIEAAWKNVLEGPVKTFSVRANHFVEKYGFPQVWDDLLRLLDHNSIAFVQEVLGAMMGQAINETKSKRELLIGKLRVLKIEREEPELLTQFENAISRLSQMNA